jgi:hypothetical protein
VFAIHDSIFVPQGQDTVDAGTDTMKAAGGIFGYVQKPDASDHSEIFVYIPGTSYMAITDTDGSFLISNIPADTVAGYKLKTLDVRGNYLSMTVYEK